MMSYLTCYMIDLTQSRWFDILTYLKVDFYLIIHHLTYLIFLINFFQSIYIKLPVLLTFNISFFQIYICRKVYSCLLKYI